jgi:D-glycero-D-manno-heptose 1,7-bisphosphate phosphatase
MGDNTVAARRAVFLDRDGVLNRATVVDGVPHPPATVDDLELLPGVADACRRLHDLGFVLLVVTNQPDIARGTVARSTVDAVNDRLREWLPLDDVLVCPHDDPDDCDCRKPRPGVLLAGAARWGVDPSASVMVGDRWRDVEAGLRAGCRTVFVDHGYAERESFAPDLVVTSLAEAVPWIAGGVTTQNPGGDGGPA